MGNINLLLDKYFEGQTSLKEEKILRDYFRKDDIPAELLKYKPVFQYFTEEIRNLEKAAKPRKISLAIRRTSLAAACLLTLFCLRVFLNGGNIISDKSAAYINGKKYTDINLISLETLRSLEDISDAGDEFRSAQIEALEAFTND
ncbi:MAG: hypothetical protein LBR64_04095 [Dysgonamonadaceae bacterium]|jgi:hypothetical protein|nr:hypothetical protein [Dysgonamonadaceae bacterium]